MRRFGNRWLYAAAGGLALGALCLAPALLLLNVAVGEAEASALPAFGPAAERQERRFTFDPAFRYEARDIGPSQQFEIRLRLVLPGNPRGYSIGVRRTVIAEHAATGRFVRLSARLPGLVRSPRPYLELSVISRHK